MSKSSDTSKKSLRATVAGRDKGSEIKNSEPVALIVDSSLHAVPHVPVDRQHLIEEAAYHHAESRGFVPGHELDDWLTAEGEVNQRLAGEGRAY